MENPLALITSLVSGKNSNKFKGIVKRDWVPTGRIDIPPSSKAMPIPTNQVNLSCW
jgi:hypothetical protein